MSSLTREEYERRAAQVEDARREIAYRAITDAVAFMEESERRQGRADGLPVLQGSVAQHIRACLAAEDFFLGHADPRVTFYIGVGFHFKLICTSLGHERVCIELEHVAVMLENASIMSAGLA
ncbi:MAG: hypothetical protein AAB367_02120 [Patescibacteria group bacterium]